MSRAVTSPLASASLSPPSPSSVVVAPLLPAGLVHAFEADAYANTNDDADTNCDAIVLLKSSPYQ